MNKPLVRRLIIAALLACAAPAGAEQRLGDLKCAADSTPRDPLTNPEARRGTMDEQFCTQLDRLPDGRSLELYGGTVDAGQRRGGDSAMSRPLDEFERQDGFVGLRLRVPLRY